MLTKSSKFILCVFMFAGFYFIYKWLSKRIDTIQKQKRLMEYDNEDLPSMPTMIIIHDNYICVGVTDADVKSGLIIKVKAFFEENEEGLNLGIRENWLICKYIDFDSHERLNLAGFGDELTFSLVSEKCRDEIVNTVINQTQELLKHYKAVLEII